MTKVRPSVVGKCTSIICTAANLSSAALGVRPGANGLSRARAAHAHLDRRAFVVFRDYPGSWSDSNEQPDFKESGSSPTTTSDLLFISVRLCRNDILLG